MGTNESLRGIRLDSVVSIGLLVVMLSGSSWLVTKLTRIESELIALRGDMLKLEGSLRGDMIKMQESLYSRMGDRWTLTMMGLYTKEIKEHNPSFATPDVFDVSSRCPLPAPPITP